MNINIEKFYLCNEDLGGKEWIDKEVSPNNLKLIGLEDNIFDFAKKEYETENVFLYVSISKETFEEGTEFQISILATDEKLNGDIFDKIHLRGLNLTYQTMACDPGTKCWHDFSSMSLYMNDEQKAFLLSFFEVCRRMRVKEVLGSLLNAEERETYMPEIKRWCDEADRDARKKADVLKASA